MSILTRHLAHSCQTVDHYRLAALPGRIRHLNLEAQRGVDPTSRVSAATEAPR